ncbi:hypothetical protein KC866_03645 [Patescibacteria group bacterium]|nr:hypothetical protein [Patescibacteria group bacterium]
MRDFLNSLEGRSICGAIANYEEWVKRLRSKHLDFIEYTGKVDLKSINEKLFLKQQIIDFKNNPAFKEKQVAFETAMMKLGKEIAQQQEETRREFISIVDYNFLVPAEDAYPTVHKITELLYTYRKKNVA